MTPSTTVPPAASCSPGNSENALHTLLNEHAALRAMLRSVLLMLERGPRDEPERFFDVLRAMLFYIDEFPEKQHHPKESALLFPRVARLAPEVASTIDQLERDHARGEGLIHSLQHALLAWEMLGECRMNAFAESARAYVSFYLEHMRTEETVILPAAQKVLTQADWTALDAAFGANRDPFANANHLDSTYDRLFTKIVTNAPAPIGVGRT